MYQDKTKEELINELQRLEQENLFLKSKFENTINEKKLAQNKFQMLFEHSPIGMALVIHETGAFLEVNNSVLKSTGYTREEFLNLSYWDITPREYEEQEIKQLQTLNETGRFGPNFKEYIRKDGSRYPLAISGALFIDTDGRKVVWGIIEDLSERRGKELTIKKQNKKLTKLNVDKDRFIQILAHDLKNPFNSLLGFSDLLLQNLHKYDMEKIEKQLKIINNVSKQTHSLLEQILLWEKSQSGKMILEMQKIDYLKTTNEIIQTIENQANEKNIKINCFETEKIIVSADVNMYKAIMRNLISNAIKFTQKNGQINIYAEKDHTNTIITVSDNGIGIDKDMIPKLWEFSNSYSTKGTNNEKGTGFGLTLCKELIKKHGGQIWIESEVGKGSNFKFTLPMKNKNTTDNEVK